MRMTDEQQAKYLANIRIAHMLARKYRPPVNWTREDWTQECLLVFAKAVVYHREELGALSTIADRLIFNRWGTLNIRRKVKKYGVNARHIAIAPPGEHDEENGVAEMIVARPAPDTVGLRDLAEFVARCVDPQALEIFRRMAEGYSLREIAESFGITKQSAGIAVAQARGWMADLFPELIPPGLNCKKCDKPIAPIQNVMFCAGCASYLRWRKKDQFFRKSRELRLKGEASK